ncbi:hypothetical protein FNF28_04811 [Cafeteria roenbergensis]|uniref:dolichyl-diphosphooligosaccharide--protein glycotransferase n=1 Tax=Cafeteria roenbergensis TaxID=33653 RepID=A0A5A8DAE3_CAFRO|nr:hypothetical protein FNF28_04811 [Cafeteria roenbergensis]
MAQAALGPEPSELQPLRSLVTQLGKRVAREKADSLKVQNHRLLAHNQELKGAIADIGSHQTDVYVYIHEKLDEYSDQIAAYEQRVAELEAEAESLRSDRDRDIAKGREDAKQEILRLTQEVDSLQDELARVQEFQTQREEVFAELDAVRAALKQEQRGREEDRVSMERTKIAEKQRLKDEMLRRVQEAKESILADTVQQLNDTTKRTLAENEQMTTELAYQSREVEKLIDYVALREGPGSVVPNMGASGALKWVIRLVAAVAACFFAYGIRTYAIDTYGRVIHEFDPYFNYEITEYLNAHGSEAFFKYFSHKHWSPIGRPIGTTSYPGMQFTSVAIYRTLQHFDIDMSLNDVCVYVPVWFGVIATIFLGLLAYEGFRSASAAVAAAVIFAVIPAHIMRSVGGGYDNESVAMSAMLITFFCWVRSLRTKSSWPWGVATGIAYFYMVAAWGGYVFVLNMIGVHAVALFFLGRYSSNLHRAYSLFYLIGTFGALQVPVVGQAPLRSLEQMGPAGVFVLFQVLEAVHIYARSQGMDAAAETSLRVKVFGATGVAAAAVVAVVWPTGYFGPLSSRVRSLFVQHTRTGNPLVDSVAEHQPASADAYWHYLHYTCLVAPLGFFATLDHVPGRLQDGTVVMVDDYREAYFWLRDNTPEDSRVMAWWDYGYQISAIANRTTIADGNTWNHEHIALLGRCLTSEERKAHRMIRHLADYVLVWAGGGGDDLAKSPHMARIGTSVFHDICPGDPSCRQYGFSSDGRPSPMMERSLLYKLHSNNLVPGVTVDSARFREVFTSKYRKVRIYEVVNVSRKSKKWAANPENWLCDAPGSWYCPGQYPPR